jgi:hypothetical protein
VLQIRNILVRFWIRGSVPLAYGSDSVSPLRNLERVGGNSNTMNEISGSPTPFAGVISVAGELTVVNFWVFFRISLSIGSNFSKSACSKIYYFHFCEFTTTKKRYDNKFLSLNLLVFFFGFLNLF